MVFDKFIKNQKKKIFLTTLLPIYMEILKKKKKFF